MAMRRIILALVLPLQATATKDPAAECTITTAGQRTIYLPGCRGVGCNAQGPDCAFCVYDMKACAEAFGEAACQSTYDARAKQGVYGCDAPAPKPTMPPTPPQPNNECTITTAGQKSIYLPGCRGVGCNAQGPDCAFCVDDMAACVRAFGEASCQATYDARAKQGVYGCPKDVSLTTEVLAAKAQDQCTITTAGQRTIYLPGCRGVGCNAQGPNCAFCVYDMNTCAQAFGEPACQATYDARAKQGVYGCDAPAPKPTMPPMPPTPPQPNQQCTITAAGQKATYLPGCRGVGCNAQGPDCAFCVYDMEACARAFGEASCQATYDARAKQGVYGCPREVSVNTEVLAAKAQDQCTLSTAGQRTIYMPNCRGTGCNAQGPNCAFCVYDMKACAQAFGDAACQATYDARAKQGVYGCDAPKPPSPPTPPTPPQPNNECTMTAAGQKTIYLPGCRGTGCNAEGPNCAFCVYDMKACAKAFGESSCQSTWDARAKQGVYGCPSTEQAEAIIV